jgi:uncharacterized cupin superfamily protein
MRTKPNFNVLFLGALAVSLAGSQLLAQDKPSIIRYQPDKALTGPNAKEHGTGDDKTTVFFYYQSKGPSKDASGIWEAANFHMPLHMTKESEFIHVVRGSLTLGYKDGREEAFQAGDNLLIPRGAEVAWKGTKNLREFWVTFDSTGPAPAGSPSVIKFERDGPQGKGLKPAPPPEWRAKEYDYYSSPAGSSAGVWETAGFVAKKFEAPNYCELMVFLDGEVTLSTPDGKSQTFKAGDVALVPKGVAHKWSSGRLRKFWVIFDPDPHSATSTN